MPIDNDKLYDELGRVWTHFASWRERIFAGYLSVLAVLGFAFSRDVSIHVRAAIFAFAILVSVVFRILDYRTTDLVNLCQDAAAKIAKAEGFYGELNKSRFRTSGRPSYGLAVDTLVAGVMGASATGFVICLVKWWNGDLTVGRCWIVFGAVLTLVIWLCIQAYTRKRWLVEKTAYDKLVANGATTPGK